MRALAPSRLTGRILDFTGIIYALRICVYISVYVYVYKAVRNEVHRRKAFSKREKDLLDCANGKCCDIQFVLRASIHVHGSGVVLYTKTHFVRFDLPSG